MDQPGRHRWVRILRRIAIVVLVLSVGLVVTVWLADLHFRSPGYQGSVSDHFDGTRFHNLERHPPPPADGSRAGWVLGRLVRPGWDPMTIQPTVPAGTVAPDVMRVTWVGHSTVLIQVGGIAILTDPIWSDGASPVGWAGPRRRVAPGIRIEDLPPISVVLVSHDHYDHCDVATLRRLSAEHHATIVAGLGMDCLLAENGIQQVTAIDWWQRVEPVPGIRITGVPSQHFSSRFLSDRNHDLWLGFVVETPAGSFYFAGDTGPGGQFVAIAQRFPALRLALIPIGAYQPSWMMAEVHLDPAGAVQAMHDLGASTALAIHWGTFPLADESPDDPPRALSAALATDPHPPRFWVFRQGEAREVP